MIHLETDASVINAIANDATVRKTMFLGMIYPRGDLDFTGQIEDRKTIVLRDDAGFLSIFRWTSPGTYECHIMALKGARGSNAMRSAREMLAYMKARGARLVWGQPSIYNRAAICFIRRMGLKSAGKGVDPLLGEVEYFVTEDL